MGPFSGYKVGDRLRLTRDVGCWAPAGEYVIVVEVSGEGNGIVVRNVSGERRTFVSDAGAKCLEKAA